MASLPRSSRLCEVSVLLHGGPYGVLVPAPRPRDLTWQVRHFGLSTSHTELSITCLLGNQLAVADFEAPRGADGPPLSLTFATRGTLCARQHEQATSAF